MPATPFSSISSRDSWQEPNYEHPEGDRGPAAAVICALLGVIATVVIVARFRSRIFLQRNYGVDDWVFLAATPFIASMLICVCLATTKYKFNLHQWDIPASAGPQMKILTLCLCVSYIVSACGIKVSVLFFYKRLTNGKLSAIYTWSVRAAIAAQSLYLFACIATICTPCRPVKAYWLRTNPEWVKSNTYRCLDEGNALLSMGCIGVFQDLIATLLPFHLISRMSLPRRQKNALYATFGGGLIVSMVGLLRVFSIWKAAISPMDFSWYFYLYALASGAEVALAAICASLPALKYYFRAYLEPKPNAYNPNVIFLGGSELSDFTDYENYTQTSTNTTMGDLKTVRSSVSQADTQKPVQSEASSMRPLISRHATAVEALDGEELVRSGIITEEALLYDSTHVRGRVDRLHDEGGLMLDD